MDANPIIQIVADAIEASGMTDGEIAKSAGVSASTVLRIRGGKNASGKSLWQVADFLNVRKVQELATSS